MRHKCNPELLKVCERVKYGNYDEMVKHLPNINTVELDDSNSYLKISPNKLGNTVLAFEKYKEDQSEDNGDNMLAEVIVSHVVPIFDYNKTRHGELKLVTLSEDPNLDYPEHLHIYSMHRFSSASGVSVTNVKPMPKLKGVKKLWITEVSRSLDFSGTDVKHVVIDSMSLAGNPEHLDDYESVFPCSTESLGHNNPPCTITCETIEVRYSNPGFTGGRGENLFYNCKTLILDKGVDSFTSTCDRLILRPTCSFQRRAPFNFTAPNLTSLTVEAVNH